MIRARLPDRQFPELPMRVAALRRRVGAAMAVWLAILPSVTMTAETQQGTPNQPASRWPYRPSDSRHPAQEGDRPECLRVGPYDQPLQDYATKKCVDALEHAAAAGDAAAMAQLGWRHIVRHPDDLTGYANPKLAPFGPVNILVTPDNNVALEWFRKAADQGNPDAMAYLGWMYFEGHGIKQNDTEGVRWMRRSAEGGARRGMALLAQALLAGRGVARDEKAGETWARRAAIAGDRRAMAILASLLLARDDRPVRPAGWAKMNPAEQGKWLAEAVETPGDDPVAWLRKGCPGSEVWLTQGNLRLPVSDLGDPYACYLLGLLYATGGAGIDKNLLWADMCFFGVGSGFGDRYSVGWYEVGNGRPEVILNAAYRARKQFKTIDAERTQTTVNWSEAAPLLLAIVLAGALILDAGSGTSDNRSHEDFNQDMARLEKQVKKQQAQALCTALGGRWVFPNGPCF